MSAPNGYLYPVHKEYPRSSQIPTYHLSSEQSVDPLESLLAAALWQSLLAAQQRTNRLLQGIIYGALGFVLGLLAMQLVVRVHLF